MTSFGKFSEYNNIIIYLKFQKNILIIGFIGGIRVIELNNIYQEDCLTFMNKLNAQGLRVDVIVTSPPYNINKEYGLYKDDKERNQY